jgi:sulfur carrier protein ThiS adenylyltransferase
MRSVEGMQIKINEISKEVSAGTTLFSLRDAIKPQADVVVLNGAPAKDDIVLEDGDHVVLIVRGQIPEHSELENLMMARHTPGVHAVVKNSSVGIAGLGGLGSAIAIALARVGVGKLVLVDFDVVEPSNLNRQQYFIDQIGMYKVDAIKQNLQRINPYIDYDTQTVLLTAENVPKIFDSVDVLVEAFDAPNTKTMLLETFSRSYPEKQIVMASGLAGFEPSNTIITRKMGKTLTIVGDLVTEAKPGTGLMSPRVGVAAHHQANAVLRILLGKNSEGDRKS